MSSKITQKECIGCSCADKSINYSDWWYCTNPKDFRDFTVLRNNCESPEWCSRKLLERVEGQIRMCEELKKDKPEYYESHFKAQHELFITIKEQL